VAGNGAGAPGPSGFIGDDLLVKPFSSSELLLLDEIWSALSAGVRAIAASTDRSP